MSLIAELKRRNVFRVAVAYAVFAWLLAQVADIAFDNFGTPDWVPKTVLFILVLGFPLAIFFAWAFELTPEGVKREKDVDRSQSVTQQTGRKLDFLIIAVLIAAVGFLLVDKFVLQEVPQTVSDESVAVAEAEKSVAVLPFVAMSNGLDDEYFADGLTEEILNSLAQLPELLVTARTSAFSFKGQNIPIPEIAAKLKVAHVVEGSVRRAGDRLRITAQLIRASDGIHLWSDTYERSGEDSFGVQGEIAEKVAAALNLVLDDDELARMHSSGLRNPEAFIAYQKAYEMSAIAHGLGRVGQLDALVEANKYLDRVIELEPEFSPAHFNHADYYVHLAEDAFQIGLDDTEIEAALEAADRDLQNAARTARSESKRLSAVLESALVTKQWRRFRELLSAAYEQSECMEPSWWGGFAAAIDPSPQLLELWQRELACDPLNFYNWVNVGTTQLALGDHQAAIATATRAMEVITHRQISEVLINANLAAGNFDAASAVNRRYIESELNRLVNRFIIEAAQGHANTAKELLDEIIEMTGEDDPFRSRRPAVVGDRELANEFAAKLDAAPLGFLTLMISIGNCYCGAPFDLEVTPNFARMIEEFGAPWPPSSSIEWPLKDW